MPEIHERLMSRKYRRILVPSYRIAAPVPVPVSSLVNSTNKCLPVLVTPSMGRYSTAYESYRGRESMLLPSFMRSLKTNKRKSASLKSKCVNRFYFFNFYENGFISYYCIFTSYTTIQKFGVGKIF